MNQTRRFIAIGLMSHLCAASFPFLAKAALGQLGPYRGALIIYIVAVALGWGVSLYSKSAMRSIGEICTVLSRPKALWTFAGMMALATISVLLFYWGLNQSNPGDFTFVVRLEHLMALLLGIVILGERSRMLNLVGAFVGFSGWLLVVNFSSVQGKALLFALGYIVTSGAASMLAKVMLRWLDDRAFFLLRMSATMATLVVMTLALEMQPVSSKATEWMTLFSTLGGGAVLSLLFLGRYFAMKRISLWLYSSLSATQMVFTPLLAWALGTPLSWQVILGGCVVTLGVTIASLPLQNREAQTQPA